MTFKGRSVISIRDLSVDEINTVLDRAEKIEVMMSENTLDILNIAKGKVIASLFFEPSTRTRLSFETAMQMLGAKVIGFSGTEGTSLTKGETLKDTALTVAQYADMIVIRHPLEGSARYVSEVAGIPVINGGDGANQHPTQTLLDLYTIRRKKGKIEGLTVAMVGDLKYGRTVHSLAYALSLFDNIKLIFVSPEELRMPKYLVDELSAKPNIEIVELPEISSKVLNSDVIYVTRIQKERFPDPQEYHRLKSAYVIDAQLMENAAEDTILMHPLPRVDEISGDVDSLKSAVYFNQAGYGVPTRMALITLLLGK
ncbi:MAG: aspartate carbamoyltransferase [Candidatus Aenigmarchaeota archaeon]|nr:aspartate carbamoyltransferase [Candidatus Aenigmarchaeota archaeon]